MNLNVSLTAGVYDAFDLNDTRAGAALDAVPTFMTMRLDRALLRPPGARGRGAAPAAASPTAVASRARAVRVLHDVGVHRPRGGAAWRLDAGAGSRRRGRGVLRPWRGRHRH